MSYPSRVVLICCGSFNPITNMHLRMFELARDKLQKTGKYKVIGGIISPVNDAYEKKGLVSSSHRIEMIKQAIKTSDWIKVDTWEADKSNWTETYGVLKHHKDLVDSLYNANSPPDSRAKRRKIGTSFSADEVDYCIPRNHVNSNDGSGPIEVKLLCGADLLESFAVPGLWKDEHIEAIVGKYGIVVISRAGSNPEQFIYDSDVLSKYQHNITIVTEWIQNEVSATKIRKALRRGESVKYLLQDSVIDYIMDKKLYGAGDNKYLNSTTPSPANDVDVESYTSCHGNLCKSEGDLDMTHHSNFLSPTIGYGKSVIPNNTMISRFRSQDFIQDEYYYSSSEYETDSPNRTPYKRPTSMGNIGGVVRRFRNMRVTTPETPV